MVGNIFQGQAGQPTDYGVAIANGWRFIREERFRKRRQWKGSCHAVRIASPVPLS